MIRVAITNKNRLVKEGLKQMIHSFTNMKVCLEEEDNLSLLKHVLTTTIHVVILEYSSTTIDGFEISEILQKKCPEVKILLVSDEVTSEMIEKSKQMGINGVFTSNILPHELEFGINEVIYKKVFFDNCSQEISKRGKREMTQKTVSFSEREKEIIELICKEFNTGEIADMLCLNYRTIESHRKRIMAKTGSKNFIGVIIFAIKHNFIQLDVLG